MESTETEQGLLLKNCLSRAGEITSVPKRLLVKHEDQSLIPGTHTKEPHIGMSAMETDRWALQPTGQPA